MKTFKIIGLALFGIWLLYIVYIYITGTRVTYIIPKGYEGTLIVIANQKNGINISKNNVVYDFTKSKIIRIKGALDTGFSPWGYTNYYFIDKNKTSTLIDVTDDTEKDNNDKKTYVWDNYFEIGGCDLNKKTRISYEVIVVSRASTLDKVLNERDSLIQYNTCKMY